MNLGARERMMVLLGIAGAVILLLYGLWRPFLHRVHRLEAVVSEQRGLDQWMGEAAREVRRLRGAGAVPGAAPDKQSLLAVVGKTAKQGGLGKAMKRVEPEGKDKVRVWLEEAAFDDLARWLERLAGEQGIRVARITVDRQEQTGLVNARMTLETRGGAG